MGCQAKNIGMISVTNCSLAAQTLAKTNKNVHLFVILFQIHTFTVKMLNKEIAQTLSTMPSTFRNSVPGKETFQTSDIRSILLQLGGAKSRLFFGVD